MLMLKIQKKKLKKIYFNIFFKKYILKNTLHHNLKIKLLYYLFSWVTMNILISFNYFRLSNLNLTYILF